MAQRTLTDRERKLVRFGGIGLVIYLVLFFGLQAFKSAEKTRREYQNLVRESAVWKDRLSVYEEKAKLTRDLMEVFRMDPAKLSRTTLVAQASSAIQQAAMMGGIQLGPVRETPSRAAGKELTGMQLEGMGMAPAILTFLEKLPTMGFPMVTDTIQISPAPMGPGMVKLNLNLLILDFEQWKVGERKPDA